MHPHCSFVLSEALRYNPILSLSPTPSISAELCRLFKKLEPQHLLERQATAGRYSISALLIHPFSSELPRTKDGQLVYINRRPTARSAIHKAICRAYKSYWQQHGTAGISDGSKGDLKDIVNAFPQRKRRKMTSSTEQCDKRQPIFVVNISSPTSDYSLFEQDGLNQVDFVGSESLLDCLQLMMKTLPEPSESMASARLSHATAGQPVAAVHFEIIQEDCSSPIEELPSEASQQNTFSAGPASHEPHPVVEPNCHSSSAEICEGAGKPPRHLHDADGIPMEFVDEAELRAIDAALLV